MTIIAGLGVVFIVVGRMCVPPLIGIGGALTGCMACWGFVVFIMVAVYSVMPVANEYGIYCSIDCRSDGYSPTISESGDSGFPPTQASASF